MRKSRFTKAKIIGVCARIMKGLVSGEGEERVVMMGWTHLKADRTACRKKTDAS